MSRWKRWLCKKGYKHNWEISVPQGPNCCFDGVDYPVRLHKLDGTSEDITKHTCITTDRRKCLYCGASEHLTLDTMGHPYKDEYYWTGWQPALPIARALCKGT